MKNPKIVTETHKTNGRTYFRIEDVNIATKCGYNLFMWGKRYSVNNIEECKQIIKRKWAELQAAKAAKDAMMFGLTKGGIDAEL